MCTCINFKTKDNYFGRNLDLEYRFNEKVVITPRNYKFNLKNGTSITSKYSMIGMATVVSNYPLYAEATNEKGLSMAGLYFPKNACFFKEEDNKLNLSPYELIPYFLGLYSSISEIKKDITKLNITNTPFSKEMPVSDLHWMISDESECIVIEQMEDGLKVYNNPIGVLTNNPPFEYHLNNINNYSNLSPYNSENTFSNKINLNQYGQGMGAIGLPGDNSPASRFIRASFNKLNSKCEDDEKSSVTQFFHILDSVSMVQGTTITKENKNDITTYSCCINTSKGIYYYKTYTNNQIIAIKMSEKEKNNKYLSIFDLIEEQQIKYIN
ncbi:MAG TPA: choloylglycine hydrolase [Clostridiaceae bacterium]|jgi:choloylglycine hydrolase|nr:choloylglycine hydrolase [Clostridia bacterium]HJJ12839.1 choloylglycine hydrolase [Clostridiaceae bacterium]